MSGEIILQYYNSIISLSKLYECSDEIILYNNGNIEN